MAQNRGQFAWVDLMTTDIPKAIAFYKKVVNWETEAWGEDYTLFKSGENAVGGVMKLPAEAQATGAPPHWMAYITVPDVDAAAEQAKTLGATILNPPTDIPQVGRFAVVQDPQGAVFSLFKPGEGAPEASSSMAPGYAWHEHGAKDYKKAFEFYSQLFGWQKRNEMEMGPGMTYLIFGDAGGDIGGMYTMPPDMPAPPHWLNYIDVDDCDKVVERIKASGGFIVNGPMDVPGGGRIAVAGDPQNAMFAIHAKAQ